MSQSPLKDKEFRDLATLVIATVFAHAYKSKGTYAQADVIAEQAKELADAVVAECEK